MAEAVGPVFTGGFEAVTAGEGNSRYSILYLADKHNDELQREGKAPVYYWMPNYVRLARRGDAGDYKFHLIHFVGVQSGDTTVGVQGTREVAGGVISLTTTAAYPAAVLQRAQQELLDRFRGKDLHYWGWRTPVAPMFRPMPIVSNFTSLTNLSPQADGSLPVGGGGAGGAVAAGAAAGGAAAPGAAAPGAAAPGAAPGGGPPGGDGGPGTNGSGAAPRSAITPRWALMPRTVAHGKAFRAPSNLDAWYWNLQGQGPGSINPTGENAYSGLVGSLPAAILWQGFHGAYSPVAVAQVLKLKVWSQVLRIRIDGNWDRVFQHFSAAASGRYFWFSGDIQTEFNNLVINGGITVQLEIDGTLPGADKMKQEMNKRVDQILEKFMAQAQQRIFEPAPPNVTPAKASSGGGLFGFLPYGGGFSLKHRRDETHLNLHYDETVSEQYLQTHVISSSLEGFYDEIKRDPQAERKYFTTLYLDDWDRKVTRIVKPVVNWPDASKKWIGEPVAFMSVQVGYPSARGDIQWVGHVFQGTDTGDTTRWEPSMAKKNASDVASAPAGWTPDTTFVKRRVHFLEPPGESDSPFMRAFVEKNVVDLDPGENGTLTNDNTIEVRADSVGKLEVGPISLNVDLETAKQVIEVEFQALGRTEAGNERGITKFTWTYADQAEPRYWEIFTGQPSFVPRYRYRVRVIVKGSIFSKGMQWEGPWVERGGNGPLMVTVPTSEDEGVTRRSLVPAAATAEEPAAPAPAPAEALAPAAPVAAPTGAAPAPAPAAAPVAAEPAATPAAPGAPPEDRTVTAAPAPPMEVTAPTERTVPGYEMPAPPGRRRVATSRRGMRRQPAETAESPAEPELVAGWSTDEPRPDSG